ncbi:unnamed protein product, partial [Rotaria sordida]
MRNLRQPYFNTYIMQTSGAKNANF